MGAGTRAELQHGPLKEEGVQKYRRLPLLARITQRSGQTTYWRSENISEGGIFVRAAPTLEPDTELEIGFFLPSSDREIVTRVHVVWVNDANTDDYDPNKPYGMGMRFIGLDSDLQEIIRQFVAYGLGQEED